MLTDHFRINLSAIASSFDIFPVGSLPTSQLLPSPFPTKKKEKKRKKKGKGKGKEGPV